jgi:hypothetical protein
MRKGASEMKHGIDETAVKAILANADDDFMAVVRMRGDEFIEEYRAAGGVPGVKPSTAHAYVCMSSAVDAFVAELEQAIEQARKR